MTSIASAPAGWWCVYLADDDRWHRTPVAAWARDGGDAFALVASSNGQLRPAYLEWGSAVAATIRLEHENRPTPCTCELWQYSPAEIDGARFCTECGGVRPAQ